MSSKNIDEKSIKEALECPICKDLFMEPKQVGGRITDQLTEQFSSKTLVISSLILLATHFQLECGHTYCLECVDQLDKVPSIVHQIVGEDFFGWFLRHFIFIIRL